MKTAILYLTKGGKGLADLLGKALDNTTLHGCRGKLASIVHSQWHQADALVFIMAAGITVRSIAPLLEHKHKDPAVVVCDEQGRYAISLLSGHIGGANSLAEQIASITGGQAVITTSSDVLGHTAIDLWAKRLGIVFESQKCLTRLMGTLVNRGHIGVWSDIELPALPEDMEEADSADSADLVISYRTRDAIPRLKNDTCLAFAPALCAGIGCNRGTDAGEIGKALLETCHEHGLSLHSVKSIATIDIKKDERGLTDLAGQKGIPILFFSKDELNRIEGVESSDAVLRATGAKAVAEPAAILGANNGKLIVRKMKWKDVTTAIALADSTWWEPGQGQLIS